MTTFPDDDGLLMLTAGAVVLAAWWWRGQLITSSQSSENDGFTEKIGETMTTIANKLWVAPAGAKPYLADIKAAEEKYSLPTNLLARLLHQESRYRQDIITGKTKSSAGALGIAQFMPATAKQFGINPLDPFASIDAAGKYIRQLYNRFGTWDKALASYNWGQGNVSRKGLTNAPTETKNYFTQIMSDIGLA